MLPPVLRPLAHSRGLPQVAVVVGPRQLSDCEADDAQALGTLHTLLSLGIQGLGSRRGWNTVKLRVYSASHTARAP